MYLREDADLTYGEISDHPPSLFRMTLAAASLVKYLDLPNDMVNPIFVNLLLWSDQAFRTFADDGTALSFDNVEDLPLLMNELSPWLENLKAELSKFSVRPKVK